MQKAGRFLVFVFASLLACVTSGCSRADLYEFNQDLGRGKADCEAMTVPDERAKCEASFSQDFATYEEERAKL